MHTMSSLIQDVESIGIKPDDTLLVHSSMKAIGEVKGRADAILDAFITYMKPGLLLFPTHTWKTIGEDRPDYNPLTEPSCVGILSNLFRMRPGVIRSLHPTHSLSALGRDAEDFTSGEEEWDSPCSRRGCYGKLYDRKAKILFLGCSLKTNTYLHGVEEWNDIPNRLTLSCRPLVIWAPDGRVIPRPMRGHQSPVGDVSQHYDKMEEPFLRSGIARQGIIGDAKSILCDAVGMADLTSTYLKKYPDLFADADPIG
jgi:aminoglycoside 3-N-acetyltransferase